MLPLSVDHEQDFADVKSFITSSSHSEVYADQNFQAPSKIWHFRYASHTNP